jgi:hypothetical protein
LQKIRQVLQNRPVTLVATEQPAEKQENLGQHSRRRREDQKLAFLGRAGFEA